jgi:hypothetical protein
VYGLIPLPLLTGAADFIWGECVTPLGGVVLLLNLKISTEKSSTDSSDSEDDWFRSGSSPVGLGLHCPMPPCGPLQPDSIRQHTSAYVSIRCPMPPCGPLTSRDLLPGTLRTARQHTSAYVSMRQHPLSSAPLRSADISRFAARLRLPIGLAAHSRIRPHT